MDTIQHLRERILKLKIKNRKLIKTLNRVYEAGYEGIEYVGLANYTERESKALSKLRHAMNYEKDENA